MKTAYRFRSDLFIPNFFHLPKRTIKKRVSKRLLINQTLKYVEDIYRDFNGFDMSYEEPKHEC